MSSGTFPYGFSSCYGFLSTDSVLLVSLRVISQGSHAIVFAFLSRLYGRLGSQPSGDISQLGRVSLLCAVLPRRARAMPERAEYTYLTDSRVSRCENSCRSIAERVRYASPLRASESDGEMLALPCSLNAKSFPSIIHFYV